MAAAVQPEQLRCLVQDCIAKHLYTTAAFYADKLVSLTGGGPGDIYLLAQTYYVSGQHRRAVLLLRRHEGLLADVRFTYLAAKCLAELGEWDEVLGLLGDSSEAGGGGVEADMGGARGRDVSTHAAACLLRGRALEALGNRQRAIGCYSAALRADPFLEEALAALLDGHMLTNAQELELIDSLPLRPEDRWLALLYRSRAKKYLQHDVMEAQLAELQAQPDDPQQQQQQQQQAADTHMAAAEQPASTPAAMAAAAAGAGAGGTPRSADRSPSPPPPPSLPRFPHRLPGSRGAGCGLGSNASVLAARADWLLHCGRLEDAYQLSSAVLASDPHCGPALTTHLCAALALGKKNELFLRGHKLVEDAPESSLSWFGVGCYYLAAKQHEAARRALGKATQLDRGNAAAWVCYGHSFAEQDESDQALAAYRTASRLFPGLHTPLLGMGCAYSRMNNAHLGERCLLQAAAMCPQDPAVAHELGVLAYRGRQYDVARQWLCRALELLPRGRLTPAWEPTVVALAHASRKLRRYDEAVSLYQRALGLNAANPTTHAGLGYTHQLAGRPAEAVVWYHGALGLRPDDAFAAEMLDVALREEADGFGGSLLAPDGLPELLVPGGGEGGVVAEAMMQECAERQLSIAPVTQF